MLVKYIPYTTFLVQIALTTLYVQNLIFFW